MTTDPKLAEPVLHDNPEHCPGSYDMHFYCKYKNKAHPRPWLPLHVMEADGCETRGEAIAQARSLGWTYHRDGTATCPICAAALRARSTGRG